jgi:hypothetical protein
MADPPPEKNLPPMYEYDIQKKSDFSPAVSKRLILKFDMKLFTAGLASCKISSHNKLLNCKIC